MTSCETERIHGVRWAGLRCNGSPRGVIYSLNHENLDKRRFGGGTTDGAEPGAQANPRPGGSAQRGVPASLEIHLGLRGAGLSRKQELGAIARASQSGGFWHSSGRGG